MIKRFALLLSCSFLLANVGCPGATNDDDVRENDDDDDDVEARICRAGCSTDADCDPGLACDESAGACGVPACSNDDECTARASGFALSPCVGDNDCFDGVGTCLDINGAGPGTIGGCGYPPTGSDCAVPFVLVTAVALDGSSVEVCGSPQTCNASGACEQRGELEPACESDDDCATTPGFQRCVDGLCGCVADDDCTGSIMGSACGFANVCGCADDSECADSANGDTCDTSLAICTCTGDEVCADGTVCADVD